MKLPRRIPLYLLIPLVLIVLIGCFWPFTVRYCNELIYRADDGTTYALATHPHGIGYVVTTHGRELDELWRPHQDPLPGGLHFDTFKWGESRSVTFYGMSSPSVSPRGAAGPAVFSRTELRRWEPPEHDFAGLGWGGERRTVGPPIPPVPITYERRVFSLPFWGMILVLVYVPLTILRRRYLASRPMPPPKMKLRRLDPTSRK